MRLRLPQGEVLPIARRAKTITNDLENLGNFDEVRFLEEGGDLFGECRLKRRGRRSRRWDTVVPGGSRKVATQLDAVIKNCSGEFGLTDNSFELPRSSGVRGLLFLRWLGLWSRWNWSGFLLLLHFVLVRLVVIRGWRRTRRILLKLSYNRYRFHVSTNVFVFNTSKHNFIKSVSLCFRYTVYICTCV